MLVKDIKDSVLSGAVKDVYLSVDMNPAVWIKTDKKTLIGHLEDCLYPNSANLPVDIVNDNLYVGRQ